MPDSRTKDPSSIVFLVKTPTTHHSQREKGLILSASRAHAARFSHKARRKKRLTQYPRRLHPLHHHEHLHHDGDRSTCSAQLCKKAACLLCAQPRPSSPQFSPALLLCPSTSSSPALYKGNSDPFASLAFTLTPQLAELITFVRDIIYPSLFFTPFFHRASRSAASPNMELSTSHLNSSIASQVARQNWDHYTSSFQDAGSAFACLSITASSMASYTSEVRFKQRAEATSLQLRLQSSVLLRQKLARTPPSEQQHDPWLVSTILWLSIAETRSGNYTAATLHSKWAWPIIKDQFGKGKLPPVSMVMILVHDIDVAIHTLSRPQIDMDWMGTRLKETWAGAKDIFGCCETSKGSSTVHRSVSEELAKLIKLLARNYAYWNGRLGEEQDMAAPEKLFSTAITTWLWAVGQLCNMCADALMTESYKRTRADRVQGLLALTLLNYVTALPQWMDRSPYTTIALQIQRLLTETLEGFGGDEAFQDALLYVLYMGTVSEAFVAGAESPFWFAPRLRRYARIHRISNWAQCQAILEQFLFVKTQITDGASWFEKSIQDIDSLSAGRSSCCDLPGSATTSQYDPLRIAGLWESSKVLEWSTDGKTDGSGAARLANPAA